MNIADALKEFFFKLNGVKPNGRNIAEVINNGASGVRLNSATHVDFEDDTNKSFVLKSSTESSTKEFRITVDDSGAITATEIVTESV